MEVTVSARSAADVHIGCAVCVSARSAVTAELRRAERGLRACERGVAGSAARVAAYLVTSSSFVAFAVIGVRTRVLERALRSEPFAESRAPEVLGARVSVRAELSLAEGSRSSESGSAVRCGRGAAVLTGNVRGHRANLARAAGSSGSVDDADVARADAAFAAFESGEAVVVAAAEVRCEAGTRFGIAATGHAVAGRRARAEATVVTEVDGCVVLFVGANFVAVELDRCRGAVTWKRKTRLVNGEYK